ncbi:uncharacterized protein [Hetaerina americana]|uniref:uncharacterized protein n=1 Tax=Hetaerina americana TaxID=62018 RepID=UPI003A7F20B2
MEDGRNRGRGGGWEDAHKQGHNLSPTAKGRPTPGSPTNYCDRSVAGHAHGTKGSPEAVVSPRAAYHVPGMPVPHGGTLPTDALKGLGMSDRRASLELRCLGMPVRPPAMPSGLVISKVSSGGSGSSRQEIPIKDISRLGSDLYRRTVDESRGGCDVVAAVNKDKTSAPQLSFRGPDVSPMSRSVSCKNGEAPLHHGSPRPALVVTSGDVSAEARGSQRDLNATDDRRRRAGPKVTAHEGRHEPRQAKDGGILGQMLGHSILGNGEITLTPRGQPLEKRAVLEAVNLIERSAAPVDSRGANVSVGVRSTKGIEVNHPHTGNRNSNGIRAGRDNITIEPILEVNQSSIGMRHERYIGQEAEVRVEDSFASRYPLLREGLSKPCLRRRGRPPKTVAQPMGKPRRYTDVRPAEYATYQAVQPQVPPGINLPEGTVVNPLVPQPYRKTMSVDEVLTYYGSMQERKAGGSGEPEEQRPRHRGETSMGAKPETSMPAMQNSSLAQIESLVQSQVPSGTGFYPNSPPSMPRYPYVPNSPTGIPVAPGYTSPPGSYANQQMMLQDTSYYGMRYRGRGRPRGRARARGRPRGNSGLYYHSSEREILPKPDYMPRQAEDVEEIVVEVDFKPEWEDDRDAECAKEDSLSEAQKLVPNWISVVPAKMSQGRRSGTQKDSDGDAQMVSSSVPCATEMTKWGIRDSAHDLVQQPNLVQEKMEVQPSSETFVRQPRQSVPLPMPTEEPKPADDGAVDPENADGCAQRAAEGKEQPVPSGAELAAIEIKVESDSDVESLSEASGDVANESVDVGMMDVSSAEDPVPESGAELTELNRDSAPTTVNKASTEKEGGVKAEDVPESDRVDKAGQGVAEKSRHQDRNRFNRLASSLASIKSLPKDVTVVRSRGKASPFDGYGSHQLAFSETIAAHLGPGIEIRRVSGSRSATRGRRGSKMVGSEGDGGRNEGDSEDTALLAALPDFSTVFSMTGSSTAAKNDKSEACPGAVAEGDARGESPAVASDVEEEDDAEEDLEEKDKTYRPAGYRGMGRRRRGRGRRTSASRSDMPKSRRKRTGQQGSAALARVKIEEEERPGDWEVFVCDLCGRSFSKRFRLAHHIRAYHPREGGAKGEDGRRVFPCQQCSKAFTRKANLKKHLRIHTGEKPFVCEECGRAFTFSKNLAQHRRVHGMERPFVCEVCGHAFRFSKNLSQHRGVHAHLKPHVCTVCGRGFTRSTHLSQHKRLHSGEKPFRCSVCGKRFAQRGHAALHTRIHTGERPYACPVCGRAFSLRAHLVRHVSLHQRDGEMGPGRPPPLPRRDRRGRDGVELVGAVDEEEEGAGVTALGVDGDFEGDAMVIEDLGVEEDEGMPLEEEVLKDEEAMVE